MKQQTGMPLRVISSAVIIFVFFLWVYVWSRTYLANLPTRTTQAVSMQDFSDEDRIDTLDVLGIEAHSFTLSPLEEQADIL